MMKNVGPESGNNAKEGKINRLLSLTYMKLFDKWRAAKVPW